VVSDEDRRLLDAVGRRIAELRRKLRLTQAELAERLETTISNYQRIEHGFQNLTILTMAKIAAALDTTVVALLKAPRAAKPKRGRPRNANKSHV
jgi:transcriptional regulator with XRE-family HTH domain